MGTLAISRCGWLIGFVAASWVCPVRAPAEPVSGPEVDRELNELLDEFRERVMLKGGSDAGPEERPVWAERLAAAIRRGSTDTKALMAARHYLADLYQQMGKCKEAEAVARGRIDLAASMSERLECRYEVVFLLLDCDGDFGQPREEVRDRAFRELCELREQVEKDPNLHGKQKALTEHYVLGLGREAIWRDARGEPRQAVDLCLRAAEMARKYCLSLFPEELALKTAMDILAKSGEIARAEEILNQLAGLKERRFFSVGSCVESLARQAWPDRGPEYWERIERWVNAVTLEEGWRDKQWPSLVYDLAFRYYQRRNYSKAKEYYERILEAVQKYNTVHPQKYAPSLRCVCIFNLATLIYGNKAAPYYNADRAGHYAELYLTECDCDSSVRPKLEQLVAEAAPRRAVTDAKPAGSPESNP